MDKIIRNSTASLYILLYLIVATISCICSIDFFNMTHTYTESIILAISFEIGSMGCLFGALTSLKNKNNNLIWILFIFLTLMQMMGNTFYAYSNIENYNNWVELFDLVDLEPITQKRIISIISGCILPLVSLSFIHLLVDLLKIKDENIKLKNKKIEENDINKPNEYDGVIIDDDDNEIKKSEIQIAKEEMENALKNLSNYKNENY